jgi:aspartate-semialdehyde dehydrogenase
MIASTYQAASGAGAAAMEELLDSTAAYLEGKSHQPRVLPHPMRSTCSATTPRSIRAPDTTAKN